MSTVFPGDVVPASHPNLKLGPGLLQIFTVDGDSNIIATKAGKLCVSSNRRNWWVDSNAKRVSDSPSPLHPNNLLGAIYIVCASGSGISCGHYSREKWS